MGTKVSNTDANDAMLARLLDLATRPKGRYAKQGAYGVRPGRKANNRIVFGYHAMAAQPPDTLHPSNICKERI